MAASHPCLLEMGTVADSQVDHAGILQVFCRDRQLSSPCRDLLPSTVFPINSFSTIDSSATSGRRVHLCTANHPRVRREKYLEFHVETPLNK